MRTARLVPVAIALMAGTAWATDVGIDGVVLKAARTGRGDVVKFISRDPAVTKGAAGDPSLLAGEFLVFETSDPASRVSFTTEPAEWIRNSDTIAKYRLSATEVDEIVVHRKHILVLRPGRLLKAVNTNPFPLFDEPDASGLTVVVSLANGNDGSTYRFCTRFSALDGSAIRWSPRDFGTHKWVGKGGVAVACPSSPSGAFVD